MPHRPSSLHTTPPHTGHLSARRAKSTMAPGLRGARRVCQKATRTSHARRAALGAAARRLSRSSCVDCRVVAMVVARAESREVWREAKLQVHPTHGTQYFSSLRTRCTWRVVCGFEIDLSSYSCPAVTCSVAHSRAAEQSSTARRETGRQHRQPVAGRREPRPRAHSWFDSIDFSKKAIQP